MNSRIIDFEVSNQFITADEICVVAGSKNYLFARFIFDPSWDGVTKTAVFSDGADSVYNMLLTDDMCRVPTEIIAYPGFYVSVYGGDLITADSIKVAVTESGLIEGSAPPEPTADIYSQLTALVASETSAASGYADDAQSYEEECETHTADAAAYAASAQASSQNSLQHASDSQNYATSSAQSASDASDALCAALDAQAAAESAESTAQSYLDSMLLSEAAAAESAVAAAGSATAAEQSKSELIASNVAQKKGDGPGAAVFNDIQYSTATGSYATAHGLMTSASGLCSFAAGTLSTAGGEQSVAIGNNSTASGENSVAGGELSVASHESSVAFGYMTTTAKNGQVVIGKHNAADSDADFIIGNGTDPNNQNNEFVIKNDEAYISGSKLATENFVSGMKQKLLVNLTTTEDVNSVTLDGNTLIDAAYKLEDYNHLIVLLKMQYVGAATFQVQGKGTPSDVTVILNYGSSVTGTSDTPFKAWYFEAIVKNNVPIFVGGIRPMVNNSVDNCSAVYMRAVPSNVTYNIDSLASIKIKDRASSANTILAGTNIQIWGVND